MENLKSLIESNTSVDDIVRKVTTIPEPKQPTFTGNHYLKVRVVRTRKDSWYGTVSSNRYSTPQEWAYGELQSSEDEFRGTLTVPEGIVIGEWEFNSSERARTSSPTRTGSGGSTMGLSIERGKNWPAPKVS